MTGLPDGIRIGHATDAGHHTGCTVILCPDGTLAAVDPRGPAPGSREFAFLSPDKPEEKPINAILLTGGSAYGLAAADGVMQYLAERGIGYQTPIAPVPLVPAAVVFDLGLSGALRFPDAGMGRQACAAADAGEHAAQGNVGAAAGATIGKWAGFPYLMKGGFGLASLEHDGFTVAAAAAVNAIGDVVNADGTVLAGARGDDGGWQVDSYPLRYRPPETIPQMPTNWGMNTTLVVVMTDAALTRGDLVRLTHQAHNGLAIAVRPSHTRHDGDIAFAVATGKRPLPEAKAALTAGTREARLMLIGNMAAQATSEAIRNAVRYAATIAGIPGLAG